MINNLIVKSYLNNLLDLSHSWYPFRRSDDNGCNIIKLGLFGWCLSSNWWNSDNDGSVDYFLPKVIKICYKTVNIAFAKKMNMKRVLIGPEETFMLERNCLKLNIRSRLSANQFRWKPKVRLRRRMHIIMTT